MMINYKRTKSLYMYILLIINLFEHAYSKSPAEFPVTNQYRAREGIGSPVRWMIRTELRKTCVIGSYVWQIIPTHLDQMCFCKLLTNFKKVPSQRCVNASTSLRRKTRK